MAVQGGNGLTISICKLYICGYFNILSYSNIFFMLNNKNTDLWVKATGCGLCQPDKIK